MRRPSFWLGVLVLAFLIALATAPKRPAPCDRPSRVATVDGYRCAR